MHGDSQLSAVLKAAFTMARPRRTVSDVAPKIGLSRDVLSNILNGRTKPDNDIVERLRKELRKPAGWPFSELMEAGVVGRQLSERPLSVTGLPLSKIPVVGSVGAGAGAFNVDPLAHEVAVPETLARIGGLAWFIEGDSMMPYLEPNMIAIFKESHTPRKGHTFLIRRIDGSLSAKVIDWRDGQWAVVSLNPSYSPEPLGNAQVLGILVGWYRVRGQRETLDADPDGLLLGI